MLNYFERIDNYKRQLYFQINGNFLDFYKQKIDKWSQDLDVSKDILKFASQCGIADSYGVLNIRCFAGELSENEKTDLLRVLELANHEIANELGENDITKSLGLPKRHFSAIVWNSLISKKKEVHKIDVLEDTNEIENELETNESEFKSDNRKRKSRFQGPVLDQ